MVEAGILHERAPVELIAGELIVPPSEGPMHASLVSLILRCLTRAYPEDRFVVRVGNPLVLNDKSEPEPDLAVVPGDPQQYLTRHPQGSEAVLVIEIAHSSLKLDRALAEDYARSGVPHYWIVDVAGKTIEWFALPGPDGIYAVRGTAPSRVLPGTQTELSLAALLP